MKDKLKSKVLQMIEEKDKVLQMIEEKDQQVGSFSLDKEQNDVKDYIL